MSEKARNVRSICINVSGKTKGFGGMGIALMLAVHYLQPQLLHVVAVIPIILTLISWFTDLIVMVIDVVKKDLIESFKSGFLVVLEALLIYVIFYWAYII